MENELNRVITETIKGMQNTEEIEIVRGIVEDIMSKSIEYADIKYKNIEENLYYSIIDKKMNFYIYNTVVEKKYINTYNDFFYPVFDEDFEEEKSIQEMLDEFRENGRAVIGRGILKAEYEEIKSITDSNRVFRGKVITEADEIDIKLRVEYETKYEAVEQELYNLFNQNMIEWNTLNIPYCKKMISIVMVEFNGDIESVTDGRKIEFNLEEYEEKYFQDYFPVWNIKKYGLMPARGAMPIKDQINYEYILKYGNRKNLNGLAFNVKGGLIIDIILNEYEFKVISNSKDLTDWEIYEFKEVNQNSSILSFDFSIESNIKTADFVENIKKKCLRTKAELRRLIESYDSMGDNLLYIDAEILKSSHIEKSGYILNEFIQNDFFTNNNKDFLILKFEQVNDSFLIQDILSFITAEIQMIYPEYECRSLLNV